MSAAPDLAHLRDAVEDAAAAAHAGPLPYATVHAVASDLARHPDDAAFVPGVWAVCAPGHPAVFVRTDKPLDAWRQAVAGRPEIREAGAVVRLAGARVLAQRVQLLPADDAPMVEAQAGGTWPVECAAQGCYRALVVCCQGNAADQFMGRARAAGWTQPAQQEADWFCPDCARR